MNETYILIAAHEPAHADVLHIAAATGHEVVETTDPWRYGATTGALSPSSSTPSAPSA